MRSNLALQDDENDPLPFHAGKLVTLWDMIQFLLQHFIFAWVNFDELYQKYQMAVEGTGAAAKSGSLLQPDDINEAIRVVDRIKSACKNAHLELSLGLIYNLEVQLNNEICTPQIVFVLMKGAREAIINEAGEKLFAFIPAKQAEFFEQEDLFGADIGRAFPSAKPEIKTAGNCLASELYTAAVFHLMRTVNIGLRAFARSLGIEKICGKTLEYCGDSSIIKKLEEAISEKMKAVSGIRDEKWEIENAFYRRLLLDLQFFKDVDRDPIAHARKTFTENGALDVFSHVRDFMIRLASGGIVETT